MSEEEQIKELTRQLSIIFPALKSIVKTMDSINQVKASLENSTILFNEVIEACDKDDDNARKELNLSLENEVLNQFITDKENIINIMYCLTIITTILQNPEIRECLGYYEAYLKAYHDGDFDNEDSPIKSKREDYDEEEYLKTILKYLNNNKNAGS